MIDIGNLFTGTKWEIISHLSRKPHSPLELATKLNTTIANISQQLRLLEAAGLVSTQKTREAERGKPRVLYSIARDFVYTIALQQGSAQKIFVQADASHKAISRIWQTKDTTKHSDLIRLFLDLEQELEDIETFAYDETAGAAYIVGKKSSSKSKIPMKNVSHSFLEKEKPFIIYERGGLR